MRHFTSWAHHAQTRKSKNSIRKRNFKSKRTRSWCIEMSDLSNDTKKDTKKSRETIPLNLLVIIVSGICERNILTKNCLNYPFFKNCISFKKIFQFIYKNFRRLDFILAVSQLLYLLGRTIFSRIFYIRSGLAVR
jgi:hypothetical protein